MKIIMEKRLREFDAWQGGARWLEEVIRQNKINEMEELIEDMYPEGIDEDSLNDFLWFESGNYAPLIGLVID